MPKRKFTTRHAAARKIARYGFENKTDQEIHHAMTAARQWSVVDSANLSRIADALEALAGRLK